MSMARNGITYEQVANAANLIRTRGMVPSISAIRAALNNEGSFSTISKHLDKWRESDAGKSDDRPMPEAVENAALSAIGELWQIASKEARDEIAALREEHRVERARMQAEYTELLKENARLEHALVAAERCAHQKSVLEGKLTTATGQLEATRKAYADLLEKLTPSKEGA
jgi:chromosome segregation ATPase